MQASSIKVKKPSATATATAADAVSIRGARDLQTQSAQAAKLLKALANPDRLLLLCQLAEQEKSVAELGELTGVAQPSLSQQLSVLRTEKLVATRREGKSIFYRIEAPEVHAVLQTLYKLFCEDPVPSPSPKRNRT